MSDVTVNRSAVALRLVHVLDQKEATADQAEALPVEGWVILAQLAGCRPGYVPSTDTRDVVVSVLRARRRFAADPFAGTS